MERTSKEFHDLRNQFEKDIKDMPFYVSAKVVREKGDNIPKDVFYTNGEINNLFQAYMCGYQLGIAVSR